MRKDLLKIQKAKKSENRKEFFKKMKTNLINS